MEPFFTRFRNPLILIAIVLIQVIGLALQVQPRPGAAANGNGAESPKVTLLRHWAVVMVTPVERLAHGTSMKVRGVWSNYVYLRGARQQNEQLKQEVARLRQEQEASAEDAAQGRRLQHLVEFKQQYISSTVAAQVIGTSGTDRSRVVYLDKGSADGLKSGQAVMTPDGIVGKLRDVFPHTAQLLLISDTTSGAGVMLQSTRIRGILRGTAAGGVQIGNLTADDRIKPGEQVLTSGGDQVYPRGLPVGTIESVAPDPQHQPYMAIAIRPKANLARLEEVLVITGVEPTLPPAAQQDAAQAEAGAAENKRAADLIAERLPSLHSAPDATSGPAPGAGSGPAVGTADVGGVPGVPNSGLPRPRPALHGDRYSPGATPSAQELQPGAPAETSPRVPRP